MRNPFSLPSILPKRLAQPGRAAVASPDREDRRHRSEEHPALALVLRVAPEYVGQGERVQRQVEPGAERQHAVESEGAKARVADAYRQYAAQ